jgi:multisubunit Na+/H+ antiporter MnhB subunit
MEQVFVVAILITAFFCLTKFIEVRYLNEDAKPLKETVRDGLVVMVCSITGAYLYFQFSSTISDFFNVVTETKVLNSATTQVFTDSPAF